MCLFRVSVSTLSSPACCGYADTRVSYSALLAAVIYQPEVGIFAYVHTHYSYTKDTDNI